MTSYIEVSSLSWGPVGQASVFQSTPFSIERGSVLVVVGANGAEKNTLLRTTYRYYKPRTGFVRLDGQDIWQMNARESARRIAVVLQEKSTDFALTVYEIIALGRIPYKRGFKTLGFGYQDYEMIDNAIECLKLGYLVNCNL